MFLVSCFDFTMTANFWVFQLEQHNERKYIVWWIESIAVPIKNSWQFSVSFRAPKSKVLEHHDQILVCVVQIALSAIFEACPSQNYLFSEDAQVGNNFIVGL